MKKDTPKNQAAGLGSMGGLESELQEKHSGNAAEAQRARLLDWLRRRPISTLEARQALDILMPAARVFELRERGFFIQTVRVHECTAVGKRHSVALYVLATEAKP